MADAQHRAGDLDKGLDFITQAFDNSATTGERLWHAELHRVRGETLLAQELPEDAEQAFDQALSVSRDQGAVLFELRAATSMARLWLDRDKREAARALLEPVHARFTEGLDTPDLVEAQALLGALEA
jgi:predicted ATPase